MTLLHQSLRMFFFIVIVRPIVKLIIGLNFHNAPTLPKSGPGIIVANHNSHLDTMVLMSLLPIRLLNQVQPVAAADYFLSNPLKSWFARNIIGILPIARTGENNDPLARCRNALDQNKLLIFFPEGSRGQPETLTAFKFGLAKLISQRPTVPVYPIYMHGLGKALPKGQFILVPFFCDIVFGAPMHYTGEQQQFHQQLTLTFGQLQRTIKVPSWD